MARLSASTIYGKFKATGEAVVNGVLRAKNGITVEGSEDHNYAGIKAGDNANDGNLMLDSNGGDLYLNWDENNPINIDNNRVDEARDFYSSKDKRILLRAKGSGGELGFYDENNSKYTIRQYNGGDLNLDAVGNIDLKTTTRFRNSNGTAIGKFIMNGGDFELHAYDTYNGTWNQQLTVSSGEATVGGDHNIQILPRANPAFSNGVGIYGQLQIRDKLYANSNIRVGSGAAIEDGDGVNYLNFNSSQALNTGGALSEQGNRVATRNWATGSNINHSELADAPSSAHHSRYSDSEAVSAVEGTSTLDISGSLDVGGGGTDPPVSISSTGDKIDIAGAGTVEVGQINSGSGLDLRGYDQINLYVDKNSNNAIQIDEYANVSVPNGRLKEKGSRVATRSWSTGNNIQHSNLADAPSSAHHSRYADSEAVSAVEGSQLNITGGRLDIETSDGSNNSLNIDGHLNFKGVDSNSPVIRTPGNGGGDDIRIFDDQNGKDILRAFEGSQNVKIPNGNLQFSNGSTILDGSANQRVTIDSDKTQMRAGGVGSKLSIQKGISGRTGIENRLVENERFNVYDEASGKIAFEYQAGTADLGELDLSNSQLDMNNHNIISAKNIKTNSGANIFLEDSADSVYGVYDPYNTDFVMRWRESGYVEIPHETFVRTEMTTDKNLSEDQWGTLEFTDQHEDVRGELDVSVFGTFSPDRTAWYKVHASAWVNNVNSGDTIQFRLQNVTDGTEIIKSIETTSGGWPTIEISSQVQLNSSKDYRIQVRNRNSSCTVRADGASTFWTIRSAFKP